MRSGIADVVKRCGSRLFLAGSFFVLGAAGGCLSLGGRTTYVQESPATTERISRLEARIAALEQAQAARSSQPYPTGERILNE